MDLVDERRAKCSHCSSEVLLPERAPNAEMMERDSARTATASERAADELAFPRIAAERAKFRAEHEALAKMKPRAGRRAIIAAVLALFAGGLLPAFGVPDAGPFWIFVLVCVPLAAVVTYAINRGADRKTAERLADTERALARKGEEFERMRARLGSGMR